MIKNAISDTIRENPVFVMLLGIVPVLGTTTLAITAVTMGVVTFFVMLFSGLFVYLIKSFMTLKTELLLYIMTTAMFTSIATIVIKLIDINMYNKLGIYLPLTVVNCLILNSLNLSSSAENFKDGFIRLLKNAVYFFIAIFVVGILREFLGSGSIFGYVIVPQAMPRLLIAQAPAGAFFILAMMCLIANKLKGKKP